jgi:hypothetical protein
MMLVHLLEELVTVDNSQQYFSYIVVVGFIGGGNRKTTDRP